MTSLQEEELNALKTRLESLKNTIQGFKSEIAELRNKKTETPTTYELLKNSGTCIRLRGIITAYPDKFKEVP
jgi:prefoldin subunit 5